MLFSKPSLCCTLVATALLIASGGVNASPAGTAASTSGSGGSMYGEPPAIPVTSKTCAYMQRSDWNLINTFDTGKLTLQSSGVWKAFDSHGVVKWSVFPTNLNRLFMVASKDLHGPDNVISVTISSGPRKPPATYNWYISAGQACTNQDVPEYANAIQKGAKVVGVTHYQREKVAPKPLKGGPGPTWNKGGDDHPGK